MRSRSRTIVLEPWPGNLWACSHQEALEFGEDPRGWSASEHECIWRCHEYSVIHEVLHRGFSSSTDIGGCFSVGRQSCSKIIRWWIFSSCPVDGCWTTSHWALGDPFTRRGNAQKHIRVMFILHPSPSFNFTGQCIEWQRMCVCQKDKSKHF